MLSILGGREVLGEASCAIRTLRDLQALAEQGLPFEAFVATARACALPENAVREIVGIKKRTLERRKTTRRLSRDESERLVNLARAIAQAREIFGDDEKARHWLVSESRALAARPIDLVRSTIGFETVIAELGQIAQGVFA